jgi:hypothetical protein
MTGLCPKFSQDFLFFLYSNSFLISLLPRDAINELLDENTVVRDTSQSYGISAVQPTAFTYSIPALHLSGCR